MDLFNDDIEVEKNDLIWQLVSIEEDVQRLFLAIKDDSLTKGEEVKQLLEEIEELAVKSRKKIIHLMMDNMITTKDETIVTQKEIQELLEDFA